MWMMGAVAWVAKTTDDCEMIEEDGIKTLKVGVEKMWNHAKFTSQTLRVVIIWGPAYCP
jgi:hypothetical protein